MKKLKKLKNIKVINVLEEGLGLENEVVISSNHNQDCCEYHYLSFKDLTLEDFEDLEFDLSDDKFFRRIPGYGIELIPLKGFSVKVPGYGSNNGYYGSNIDLVIEKNGKHVISYDVSDCQSWCDG